MNKRIFKVFLLLFVTGILSIGMVSTSSGFGTQRIDQDTEWTFYGYMKNTFGVFTDRKDNRMSGDDLSAFQTILRTYTDIKFNDNLTGFVSLQWKHDPWYEVELGSSSSNNGIAPAGAGTLHGGHEYSEWWNVNQVLKEIYLNWQITPNTGIKIGRQIVIWGESIATRTTDVIHMDDTRGAFMFADLDATRIPMYMIRTQHYIPSIDLEIDWLLAPNIEGKGWRLGRSASGGSNMGAPSQRFGIHGEDRDMPPIAIGWNSMSPLVQGFLPPKASIYGPMIGDWGYLPAAIVGPMAGWANDYNPTIKHDIIKSGLDDMRMGIRFGKFIGNTSVFFQYYHTQQSTPTLVRGPVLVPQDPITHAPGVRQYTLVHPDINIFGLSASRDLDFGLIKAELQYIPDYNFGVLDYNLTYDAIGEGVITLNDPDGIKRDNRIMYMIAWSGKFFTQFNKGSAFEVDLEHNGTWIPDADHVYGGLWATWAHTWDPGFSMRVSTQWFHLLTTQLMGFYNLGSEGGAIVPSVKYEPNWMKNRGFVWSFNLQYVRVYGKSDYDGIGIMQQNDMATFTTQFNF